MGSFGGPAGTVGVQRGQGVSWEGLGGPQGGSWGPGAGLVKRHFLFPSSQFVNCLLKYLCFQFGVVLSAVGGHWIMLPFMVFRSLYFCETMR